MNTNLQSDIQSPKKYIDLHLHLLGAIPKTTLITLIEKASGHNGYDLNQYLNPRQLTFVKSTSLGMNVIKKLAKNLGPEEVINNLLSFNSLNDFLAAYILTASFVRNLEDFKLLCSGVIKDLKSSGLAATEVTFSPTLYMDRGLSLASIIAILSEEKEKADINIGFLLDPIRDKGCENALKLLNKIYNINPKLLCGVSLAGREDSYPLSEFAPYFNRARELGLGTTTHAGEGNNSHQVSDAIKLKINRIGHGVAAALDDKLIEKLAKSEITLEICPTGNIKTGLFKDLSHHPIRKLYKAGVKITINTDDPFFFDTNLPLEFSKLLEAKIFSDLEIDQIRSQAFKSCFLNTSSNGLPLSS
jgi:adenosine deaminase